MKIRNGYVSNSSSSSFVIAYDKNIYGNLSDFFSDTYLGCETNSSFEQYFNRYYLNSDSERENFQKIVQDKKNNGMDVIYIGLDRNYFAIIEMLKLFNEKHGGLEILYGDSDD